MGQREISASRGRRLAWAWAGHVCVALGLIGALLPLMPTTVFLIMAASCYARSSERLYQWLLNHKALGPVLRDWIDHRSMGLRPKIYAITAIVIAFGLSFFAIPLWWVRVIHVAIGVVLVGWLVRIPLRDRKPAGAPLRSDP